MATMSNTTATTERRNSTRHLRLALAKTFLTLFVVILGGVIARYVVDDAAFKNPSCSEPARTWLYTPDTLASIAMQCVGEGRTASATVLATAALARQPENQLAMATLGSVADMRGNIKNADQWFGAASRLGHRDYSIESYWLSRSLEKGDYAAAIEHLDALLRSGWNNDILRDFTVQQEGIVAGRTALSNVMDERSPWARSYLQNTTNLDVQQLDARSALLKILADRRGTVLDSEGLSIAAPTINSLFQKRQIGSAYALRNAFQPPVAPYGVTDENFARMSSAVRTPFDWMRSNEPGLNVQESPSENGQIQLRVNSIDSGRYLIASQVIRLQPGEHQITLAGQAREDLTSKFVVQLKGIENGEQISPATLGAPRRVAPSRTTYKVVGTDRFFRLTLWVDWSDGPDAEIVLSRISDKLL